MKHSRRRFLASLSAGTALVAGCLDTSPEQNVGKGGDNGDTDAANDGNGDCDPLDLSAVDEPPHAPERPSQPDDIEDADEWDDHHLGDGMEAASDLSFERIDLSLHEPVMDPVEFDGDAIIYADLLTDRETFDERVEPRGADSEERIEAIDFDEEVVILVVSGFGSSSKRHEWVRVEQHCEEIHVHGYYRWPYLQTDDIAPRISGVIVNRPAVAELKRAWVSLTTGIESRHNVSTDQDMQVINDDNTNDEETVAHGAIDDVEVLSTSREFAGDWAGATDDPGVVVHLDDEEHARALVDEDTDLEQFLDITNFEEDTVFFLESAGPNACHRSIDVLDVMAIAEDARTYVRGHAKVVDESDEGGACADVLTYPSALIRVESDIDLEEGEFEITDGWDEVATIDSISFGEFAQE